MEQIIYSQHHTLNIQVIEAKEVPSMDRNGLSDPFLKLYLLGPKPNEKKEETKTKIIKKTLNPVWNEEFHFSIKSLGTDILHMSFKDWNSIGKDDPISTYELQIRDLIPGKVYDEWLPFIPVKGVPKGGIIHLKYHLTPPGTKAYEDNPLVTKSFHIKIIEAKEVKPMDLNGFSDPFCRMKIIGDRIYSKTSIKKETLSPYWDETFHFIINNYEADIFQLDLMDKDTFSEEIIGSINLSISQFEIGKVYKKWVEVQSKEKKTGLVRVLINVNNKGEEPFLGEIVEEKKNFIESDKWGVNIHLIRANNLPSADSNGLSDPYCRFSIINKKFSIESRRIDKCLNPIWDEYFHIPIDSLNSDILRLEIIDWNKIAKHSKLCMKDFRLSNFEFGKIYSNTYSFIPLEKRPGGSTVELTFQITPPSIKPFTEVEYIPDILNVKLESISGVTIKKLKKPKLYFNLKLENDSNEGIKTSIKEELNTELNEEFNFIITDQSKDKLIIEYKNEANKNKIISKCIVTLKDLQQGIAQECQIKMEPCGLIHLNLTKNKKYLEKKESVEFEEKENNNDILKEEEENNLAAEESEQKDEKEDENSKLTTLNDIIETTVNVEIKEENINEPELLKDKKEENNENNCNSSETKQLEKNSDNEKNENKDDKKEIKEDNKELIETDNIKKNEEEEKQLLGIEDIITSQNIRKIESDNMNSCGEIEPKGEDKIDETKEIATEQNNDKIDKEEKEFDNTKEERINKSDDIRKGENEEEIINNTTKNEKENNINIIIEKREEETIETNDIKEKEENKKEEENNINNYNIGKEDKIDVGQLMEKEETNKVINNIEKDDNIYIKEKEEEESNANNNTIVNKNRNNANNLNKLEDNNILEGNVDNLSLIKKNEKEQIVENQNNKKNDDILSKQKDDVKIVITNSFDDNIYGKEQLGFPFDNLREVKCCPDCVIF